jgi:hypothetical protein
MIPLFGPSLIDMMDLSPEAVGGGVSASSYVSECSTTSETQLVVWNALPPFADLLILDTETALNYLLFPAAHSRPWYSSWAAGR